MSGGSWSQPRRVDEDSYPLGFHPDDRLRPGRKPGRRLVRRPMGGSTEIFCARWDGDGFGLSVMVSTPDGSPDSNPAIAPDGEDGFLIGLGRMGRRIFPNLPKPPHRGRVDAGRDGGPVRRDRPDSPRGRDQHHNLAGRRRDGHRRSRHPPAGRDEPEPEGCSLGSRTTRHGGPGDGLSTEPGELTATGHSSPFFRRKSGAGLPRRGSVTNYYIGYGDSITYGHDNDKSDTSGWYGSLLAGMLPALFPGQSFYFYNEGYPAAECQRPLERSRASIRLACVPASTRSSAGIPPPAKF